MCEPKPPIISQQCILYNYQCDLCDAQYVSYTSRHLFQRIDAHCYSAISKHLKNDHGLETIHDLANNFSILKCNRKLDCLIYEMLFIRKRPCLNTIKLCMCKTIYLNLSPFTCTPFHLYVLSPRMVYIKLSIVFSLHLKMMTWSHRNVV